MNALAKNLITAQALIHAPRKRRLTKAPLRTMYGFLYSRIIWGWFGGSYEKRAQTFYGDTMITRLPVGLDLYLHGVLADHAEIQLTHYLLDTAKPGMIFFDVGASYGFYTLLMAKLVGDRGAVHAFEASPTVFRTLQKNVQGRPHIRANHAACSDHDGMAQFFEYSSGQEGASSLYPQLGNGARSQGNSVRNVTVQAMTLDSYCAQQDVLPDMVKIDVEGAERDVVAGMRRIIAQTSPVIAMEFWYPPRSNASHRAAVGFLVSRGYRVFAFVQDNTLERISDVEHRSLERTTSENLILLRT